MIDNIKTSREAAPIYSNSICPVIRNVNRITIVIVIIKYLRLEIAIYVFDRPKMIFSHIHSVLE